MKSDKILTFLMSFFGLNLFYIFISPFIMITLILNIEERLVDSTMIVISILFEILVILFSLLLSYKLNYGGDE